MSSLAISSTASTTLPAVGFHLHGHKKGLRLDSLGNPTNNTGAQIPVGAMQSLFSNLLQTLERVVGVQTTAASAVTTGGSVTGATSAAATASTATGTAPATATAGPTVAQDLNGFLHSLFQVLKQDGLGSGAGAGTPAAAPSAGAGHYQGSLASSLQTLIQQVGSNGSTNPAVAKLDTSFNTLVQAVSNKGASTASTSAAGGAAPTQSSNAELQNFLTSLLQNLQANGLQSPKLTGSSVNANV